ncbi:MAG: ATP-binding protein [Oscillospiraceae bacterium]
MMQELSMNILDVAENSVRAGASLVEITVDRQPVNDLMTITISDNGCGMSPEQLKKVSDPFYTTRTTRSVGLGIPFFRMAAELTGGKLEISSTQGVGTLIKASFVLSSIDLMPLGNINETIFVLIHGNPDMDFVFTHRLGGSELVLDTRSFRRILGDIPLNDPKVSSFIREFLDENTRELLQAH